MLDADGPRLELTARSAGGYLLDNEALPMSYDAVELDGFCRRYLDGYGIFRRGFSHSGQIPYTVPKGQSEWEALCGFTQALTGAFPYLSREGKLCLLPRTGERILLSNRQPEGVRFLSRSLAEHRSSRFPRCWFGTGTVTTPPSSATAGPRSWESAASAT